MEKTEVTISNSFKLFFRGIFSVDMLLITYHQKKLKILLQGNKEISFQDEWGLRGELILPNGDAHKAMDKLMLSLVGQSSFYKNKSSVFSNIDRHPVRRIVTFTHYGLIPFKRLNQTLSSELKWCEIYKLPILAFDHNDIVNKVLKWFQKELLSRPLVFHTLPDKFILSEFIGVSEQTLNKQFEVRNFRKKILTIGIISPLGEFRKSKSNRGRPAELYAMNPMKKKTIKDLIRFDIYN